MTRCQNTVVDGASYWLAGKRTHVPCNAVAAFVCKVNPWRPENDGTVMLCKFCGKWDYQGFPKWTIPKGGA